MTGSPGVLLLQGAQILGQKLYPLDFRFEPLERGEGSGGPFAVGHFHKDDRAITLWYRYDLGSVSYRKAAVECTHTEYMQAIGRQKDAAYPGFSSGDPVASFRHLLADLQHCNDFLLGDGSAFVALIRGHAPTR